MPIAGAGVAIVFYEFVFVKSQEYLNEEASSDGEDREELSLQDGIDASPPQKRNKKGSGNDRSIEDEELTNNE